MTERYLVMLRGINVGTRNRVPMAELRSKLANEGYSGVATFLQSGTSSFPPNRIVPMRSPAPWSGCSATSSTSTFPASSERRTRFGGCSSAIRCGRFVSDPSRYLVNFLSDKPDPEVADGT